jgi:hypothetical protein
VRLPARLITIIEGEGLLNDATALTLLTVAVTAVTSGGFSFGGAVLHFLAAAAGGLLSGVVVALVMRLLRHAIHQSWRGPGAAPAVAAPDGAALTALRASLEHEAGHDGEPERLAADHDVALRARREVIDAQREELLRWRDAGHLPDSSLRVLERELDHEERTLPPHDGR